MHTNTRHLIQIYSKGKKVVNQFGLINGDPEQAGVAVLDFLFFLQKDEEAYEHFGKQIERCRFVTDPYRVYSITPFLQSIGVGPELKFTKQQYQQYVTRFPQFSCYLSSDILSWIYNEEGDEVLWVENYNKPILEELLIEWTYQIDLDNGTFIVDGHR